MSNPDRYYIMLNGSLIVVDATTVSHDEHLITFRNDAAIVAQVPEGTVWWRGGLAIPTPPNT